VHYGCSYLGQLHFRKKVNDNFYTGLSLHEPCVSSGFVFTSAQVCSQGSSAIRSMVGMYFSHGFGVYSCLFGVFPSVQWFPKLYTDVLILWNIDTAWKHYGNKCSNPIDSSTLHDTASIKVQGGLQGIFVHR